jgi:uncharacterized protein YecT (DUF1311 family)
MQGFCSSLELRFDEAKRKKRIAALTAEWSGKDKESLAVLNTAFEGFVKARVNNEVDLSGTGRNAFMIEEEMVLHKDFQEMLEVLEQGKLPHYSQEDFSKADRELNIAYQQLQKMDNPPWGTVTNAGIKQTQRTWLTYRDAWVVYGLHKYPGSHAEYWKTWLTLKRVEMLKGFVDS